MSPLKVRCFGQTGRMLAVSILLCFFVFGLVPVANGQAADASQNNDYLNQLISLLQDANPQVRLDAIRELRDINDPRTIEPLIAALKDKNPRVRQSAAIALGRSNDHRAISPLTACLKDTDFIVREIANKALKQIKDSLAVESSIADLHDHDATIRKQAGRRLAKSNDTRAVIALLAAWKDRDMAVIAGADTFFITRGEPGSEDVFIQALHESGDEKMAEDFLDSGNTKLSHAGGEWATEHGYQTMRIPGTGGGGSARWGSAH